MGKNFPNDKPLKNKYGTHVLYKKSRFDFTYENAIPHLKKLLWNINDFEKEDIRLSTNDMVEYHEYGHNLFIPNHSTLLEETKPSLFYNLKLFDENEEDPLTPEKIKSELHFILVDTIRYIERREETQCYKYLVYTKLVLSHLFSSGLIFWDGGVLSISPTQKTYQKYLISMKNELYRIEEIYQNDIDGDNSLTKNQVDEYIQKLDKKIDGNFRKMYRVMWI